MKKILCKLFGHKWEHTWHRHNCYFAAVCLRCGTRPNKKRNLKIRYK